MSKFLYKHRRGTTAQWTAKEDEIIPQEGEIVIELTEDNLHKLKIGDGKHTYKQLAYLKAGDEIVSQVLPHIVTVTLDIDKWALVEGRPYYSQDVEVGEITTHSRLDLQPNADMLAEFQSLNLVFVTENNGKAITVYSVGDKPLKTYTMQATIVETDTNQDCVIGIPIGTPTVNSDWNQNDETKADYIKNKPNVEALDNRVTNLEKAAMGNIYETAEVAGTAYTIQLPDTSMLPYGILSQVGGNVSKVEIGMPYNLTEAKAHTSKVDCIVNEVDGSVIMPQGSKNYIYFPCVLPKDAIVAVYADGKNTYADGTTDSVAKFIFLDGNLQTISTINPTDNTTTSSNISLGTTVKLDSESSYLAIYKTSASSSLKADLKISNIRVILDDPKVATIYGTIKNIPEEIRNLNGYGVAIDGENYNYLDVSGQSYHQYYQMKNDEVTALDIAVITDVSEYLPSDFDVVHLLPGCLVRFSDEEESKTSVPYSLYYKTKITSTEQ